MKATRFDLPSGSEPAGRTDGTYTRAVEEGWAPANEYRRRRRCSFPLISMSPAPNVTSAGHPAFSKKWKDADVIDEEAPAGEKAALNGTGLTQTTDGKRGLADPIHCTSTADAVEKIRRLLSTVTSAESSTDEDDADDDSSSNNGSDVITLNVHKVFCQMDMLCRFETGDVAWKEVARWIKYEEKVDSGNHWSKPHVSTLPLHAIMQLRHAVADGRCVIDLNVPVAADFGLASIAAHVVDQIRRERQLTAADADELLGILLRPHKHKHRELKRGRGRHHAKSQQFSPGSPDAATGLYNAHATAFCVDEMRC